MPFVDLSGQQVNPDPNNATGQASADSAALAAQTAPADIATPVTASQPPNPLPSPAPVQTTEPVAGAELNSLDVDKNTAVADTSSETPLPPNELNSLGMSNSINSAAIAPEDTEAVAPDTAKIAKDELELNIDNQGVKTMSGPALESASVPVAPEAAQTSSEPANPTPADLTTSAMAAAGTKLNPADTAPAPNIASVDATTNASLAPSEAQLPPLPVEATQSPGNIALAPATETAAVINSTINTVEAETEVTPTVPTDQTLSEADFGADEGELPAETDIETLTNLALERKASDIHFAANYPVMLRVDGSLHPVTKRISAQQAMTLAESLLVVPEKKAAFDKEKEVDFSFTNSGGTRFRVNLYTERGNAAGAMRLISTHIRTIEELELPQIFYDIINEPHGLVLLVGPTGSGKSTTLAALLNYINLNRREHIITIEDPIEYVYPIGKSIVDQRELEADTMSWQRALKSALREDPNIVLVGEMRDIDTIASTITIAETGHLVFATLHTNSASQAIDRIIDVFPEGAKAQIRAQLANVITAVISQRLIPVQQGGRRAALEIMLGTPAVKNAIREGKTYQIDNIIQTSGDLGMLTLEKSLVEMVKKGYITKEQAKEASVKPDDVESLLAKS